MTDTPSTPSTPLTPTRDYTIPLLQVADELYMQHAIYAAQDVAHLRAGMRINLDDVPVLRSYGHTFIRVSMTAPPEITQMRIVNIGLQHDIQVQLDKVEMRRRDLKKGGKK